MIVLLVFTLIQLLKFFSSILLLIKKTNFHWNLNSNISTLLLKNYLNKKIIEISNSKIMAGDYKGVFLLDKSNWSKFDFATKLLGSYEQQIQKLIVNVQKKNNLKNFINIGAGDGYHTLGLIKNNFFNQAICYEISQQTRNILEYNLKINNIEDKVLIYQNANI